MVVLPVVVATWWWNSKKYTRDRVLRQTINLYYQYLRPQMPVRGERPVFVILRGVCSLRLCTAFVVPEGRKRSQEREVVGLKEGAERGMRSRHIPT